MYARLFIRFLCFFAIANNCQSQTQYISPAFPEVNIEAARKAIEDSRLDEQKISESAAVVANNPWVIWSIASDLLQQHSSCFLRSEAHKKEKAILLDHELSETERLRMDAIFSTAYRDALIKHPLFFALRDSIARKISLNNQATIDMANKLLKEDVGVDFVLAWITPLKTSLIDKSCGTLPSESVLEDWRQQALWVIFSKTHQLE